MLHLIGFIFFGLIVGLIARLILPGRQNMSLTKTALLGMAGALIAGWAGRAFGWYGPNDGAGYLMSTGGAIALLVIYHLITKKRASAIEDRNRPRRAA